MPDSTLPSTNSSATPSALTASTVLPTASGTEANESYWANVKDVALSGFAAALGDPDALQTVIDIVTNASCNGLEHMNLDDAQKNEVKKKLEKAMNNGADSVIAVLNKFQKSAAASNARLREKYGRKNKASL